MHSLISFFVLTLAAVSSAKVMPVWNKDFSNIEPGMRTIPSAKVTNINRWTSSVPKQCWDAALANKCTIPELDVFEATFADASKPWVVCRCKNAPYSESQFLTEIGRLAPAIRQRTRYFMLFQGSGWAYSNDNDVVMLGVLAPTTLLHEAAHAFDDAGSRSYTDLFKKAVELDSCWADNYAKSTGEKGNYADPWAQILVLHQYIRRVGNLPKDPKCMTHQIWALALQVQAEIDAGFKPDRMRPRGPVIKRNSAKFRL